MKTIEEVKHFLKMSEKVMRAMMGRPDIKTLELMAFNERAMTLQMIIDWLDCEALDGED